MVNIVINNKEYKNTHISFNEMWSYYSSDDVKDYEFEDATFEFKGNIDYDLYKDLTKGVYLKTYNNTDDDIHYCKILNIPFKSYSTLDKKTNSVRCKFRINLAKVNVAEYKRNVRINSIKDILT